MSRELFPAQIPDDETEAYLDTDQAFYDTRRVRLLREYDAALVESRRFLLGPRADITHPEFGRPNRPEETFALCYRVHMKDGKVYDEVDGKHHDRPVVEVDEYIFDEAGNLISYEPPEFPID